MPHVLPDQENIKYVSKSVLNITGLGDIQTSGSLSVGSGKFVVSDGVMTTQSLNVQNSLDVHGTAVIEDSLTIGSGFALTPEGMTIDTSRHTGALLELRSSQKQFDGAYLEINSLTSGQTPANSSMIRTSVDGFTTFDLKTNGHLIVNGIQMKSGGFVISSGGMNIESGGLVVKGGITMESGVLDLRKNNMKLSSITLENHDSNSHILQIDNYNSHFIGPVISINQNNPSTSTLHENYIIMETKKNQKTIFQLDSDGNIESNGSMKLKNKLILENNLHINGMISFTPYQIIADDEITLPSNHVFIEILDDHKESKNIIFLPILNIVSGQMMILRNLDMNTIYLTYYQTTSTHQDNSQRNKIKIPSNVSILLIYNGYDWIDIQSLSTSIEKLKNIQELTFQNDVNVGNITMTTGGYRMYGLNKGEVLVGGIGGTIKGRKGLIYSNGILSTQGLKVEILESDIDGNMKTIS